MESLKNLALYVAYFVASFTLTQLLIAGIAALFGARVAWWTCLLIIVAFPVYVVFKLTQGNPALNKVNMKDFE